jgi:hypothetical protein
VKIKLEEEVAQKVERACCATAYFETGQPVWNISLVGAARFELATPCAQGSACDFSNLHAFNHIPNLLNSLPVEHLITEYP